MPWSAFWELHVSHIPKNKKNLSSKHSFYKAPTQVPGNKQRKNVSATPTDPSRTTACRSHVALCRRAHMQPCTVHTGAGSAEWTRHFPHGPNHTRSKPTTSSLQLLLLLHHLMIETWRLRLKTNNSLHWTLIMVIESSNSFSGAKWLANVLLSRWPRTKSLNKATIQLKNSKHWLQNHTSENIQSVYQNIFFLSRLWK